MVIEVKVNQWGNSMGVVIPRYIINKLKIRKGEEIIIEIEKKENVLKELFGALKSGVSGRKILNELRESMESKLIK